MIFPMAVWGACIQAGTGSGEAGTPSAPAAELTGWNWINGRCYYLEPESGRMLSDAVTPDGYTVDGSGAWTVNGKVQVLGRDLEEGR